MLPKIFEAVDVPAVRALLRASGGPTRFYLFGRAPQDVVKPYAVWRISGGQPENYVNQRPDYDAFTLQIDVFALPSQGTTTVRAVASAIRDAIEDRAHVTGWIGEDVDPDTQNFRLTFLVDWWEHR